MNHTIHDDDEDFEKDQTPSNFVWLFENNVSQIELLRIDSKRVYDFFLLHPKDRAEAARKALEIGADFLLT